MTHYHSCHCSESAVSVVMCVTRLSNPAPLITWRLGPDLLSAEFHNQTEGPEPLEPGKLVTTSELRYTFTREHEGQQVGGQTVSVFDC